MSSKLGGSLEHFSEFSPRIEDEDFSRFNSLLSAEISEGENLEFNERKVERRNKKVVYSKKKKNFFESCFFSMILMIGI